MEKKPIKRSIYIQPLSRDHHFGLLFCWKIRKGLKQNIASERIKQYVAYFWNNHLQEHFREEEEHLFYKVEDAMCREGLQQHQAIETLIQQITGSQAAPAPEQLDQLADAVDNHIRFEERKLFPHLEAVLDEQELVRIGAALELAHAAPAQDNFPDEFWVNSKT